MIAPDDPPKECFCASPGNTNVIIPGKVLAEMDRIQRGLDETDFLLCCALEAVVTLEMRQKTPNSRETQVSVMADYCLRDGISSINFGSGSIKYPKYCYIIRERFHQHKEIEQ